VVRWAQKEQHHGHDINAIGPLPFDDGGNRLPDWPALLQTYLWQEYDLAPRFPRLHELLAFWERHLDGPLHSVRVASAKLITPLQFRHLDADEIRH